MADISGRKVLAGQLDPNTAVFVPNEPSKWWSGLKMACMLVLKITSPRNPKFHKKFFSMLNFAFEHYEHNQEYNGEKVEKEFEKFRSDTIILAGYYDVFASLSGQPRAEAKSISFGSMKEPEFEKLYKACFNVLWRKIFIDLYKDQAELERVLLEFNTYD